MPRFVVLEHDSPHGVHWDLMLEDGPALATWQLGRLPQAPDSIPAHRLADHRLRYLDYEGPISGDRGTVARWDQGTYQTLKRSETEWVVRLAGQRLCCQAVLKRAAQSEQWRLRLG